MKKILLLSALAFGAIFTSCGGGKAQRAQDQADSLTRVVVMKDSIINDAFTSISEIASNVNRIAEREKLITTQTEAGRELSKPMKDQIVDNITAIGELLDQNRTTITKLQATSNKLRQANIQIESLQKLVRELQEQLVQKNAQIADLMEQVRSLKIEVAALSQMLLNLEADKILLQGDLSETDKNLHTVHYIVGADRELKQEGIVDKEGFIGRTKVLGEHADQSMFTKADDRILERIPIGGKRITVVTSHPADSYMLIQGDKHVVDELVITDKEAFWKNSKVLVVSYH